MTRAKPIHARMIHQFFYILENHVIIQNTNKETELWKQLSHSHSTSFPQISREIAAKLIDQMSSEELYICDKHGRIPLH